MATRAYDESTVSTDEKYEGAAATSDLTVGGGMIPKDHKSGPGEVVAAAGMAGSLLHEVAPGQFIVMQSSPAALGMALLRLHSEFASTPKPRRIAPPTVEELAAKMPLIALRVENGRTVRGPDIRGAVAMLECIKREAIESYANELRLIATRLKSRHQVIGVLTVWAATKGIGESAVSEAVLRWLDPHCPVCNGHAFLKVPDQPALSAKRCPHCHNGEIERSRAADRVIAYIEDAVNVGRQGLRRRLRRW